jgi:hypothetical protein
MPGRSALVAPMIVILAGALAADCAWARGRGGGHGGGKRGGGAHAGATAGGGARAAHVGTASGGGERMARANSSTAGGAPAAGGGASAAQARGASAGALHAGGVRLALGAGVGGLLALGAFPRIDGRFYGNPPPRAGAAVGIAAFWEAPPPNYPAPVVVVPYHPSEYIETGRDQAIVTPPRDFWYFCPDANGYFPHVDDCPGGWELVAPPGMAPTRWLGNPVTSDQ